MTKKYEYNTLKSANEKIESLKFRYDATLSNHKAYIVASEKELAETKEKFGG